MLLGLFLISHVFKYSYYTPLNISFEAILTHVAFGDVSTFDMSFCVCTQTCLRTPTFEVKIMRAMNIFLLVAVCCSVPFWGMEVLQSKWCLNELPPAT